MVYILSIWLCLAHGQDWSRNARVPPDGRANPYLLAAPTLANAVESGRRHALNYPVTVTGVLLPYRPIADFVSSQSENPLRLLFEAVASSVDNFTSMDDVEAWLGLTPYPSAAGTGLYHVPFPADGSRPADRMGLSKMRAGGAVGFTVSCAQCHGGQLFGRPVLGLTTRFPRANALFVQGLQVSHAVTDGMFQYSTGASAPEMALFNRSRFAFHFIGAQTPAQLGLDTSLAQVALSLAKRALDPWASLLADLPPRADPITQLVSDSKPAVWWNLKYKNRWLADGSVVSGNPIFTNFIWNEIGRGTDLHALSDWLDSNTDKVRELTTAAFAAEAPRWTDFFPSGTLDENKARRGEALFLQNCASCHGIYTKAWSLPHALDPFATVSVEYPNLVVDVGTDPGRYLGMRSLLQLNDLEISKRNGVVIEAQTGYMPPPLVGIWARWPYFHNNSAPSLCAVLTRGEARPNAYAAREALDPANDFDSNCNGYPADLGEASAEFIYDTSRHGMSARGHDEGILLDNGVERFTPYEKMALIEFLKTL